MRVAALYVATGGCYFGLPDVDPWDEQRDARLYAGPHPVVAHPPCERWGRYWWGGPELAKRGERRALGDDGGCFAAAIAAVRTWGGVLEHPEGSQAWRAFGLSYPRRDGGWSRADAIGWTCCVEQGSYGHRARKATWLYAVGVDLPDLEWRADGDFVRARDGRGLDREVRTGACQRMSRKQRRATPPAFRDVLLAMARTVTPQLSLQLEAA